MSLNRACQLMRISKTAYYYQPKKRESDKEIEGYLKILSEQHKRWGFKKMMLKARLDEKPWNHKRVYRIYCDLKLNLRIKPRKRLPSRQAKSLVQPLAPNLCWSIDFMSDMLSSGQKFRTLNVIDDYNREALSVSPRFTLTAAQVIRLLEELILTRGYPEMIRVDNGPEFRSKLFREWAKLNQITLLYIQPGKPAQNGYIERFNRTYREDVLDMNLLSNLKEARELSENWRQSYNAERPHESLAGLTPIAFVSRLVRSQSVIKKRNSTLDQC